ncbi:hypothetical protein M8C17_01235 [Micromonospora sp. RHAY321]|uniref:hypothetical protein n=1 Tax=Micromonospora sp. RHAY321 TaxID=2944807 RepID=UPI00207CE2C6|nr:hypothetical protein [Micromonospora sp. RHAY321]MCO1593785.1 hypothetical protein [Micromonospora sp. RHAY321]
MVTKPVIAGRMELVDDLEGLPGSSGGCLFALTLEVPVFLRVGDVWWVEDEVLYVQRGDVPAVAHRGRLEWRRRW